jgi:two-component system sensor histidine kinase YesM
MEKPLKKVKNLILYMNIRPKLIFTYILFLIIPLIICTSTFYFVSVNQLKKQTIISANQVFEKLAYDLNNTTYNVSSIMDKFATNQTLIGFLRQNDENIIDYPSKLHDYMYMNDWINDIETMQGNINICVYLMDYDNFLCDNVHTFNLNEINQYDWFKSLEKTHAFEIWFESDEQEIKYISAVKIIWDPYDINRIIGVIRINIPRNIFIKQLNNSLVDAGDQIGIVDNNFNEIVTCGSKILNIKFSKKQLNASDHNKDFTNWYNVNVSSDPLLVRTYNLSEANWNLVSVIPIQNMLRDITVLKNTMIVVLILISILGFLIAWYAATNFTNRIHVLILKMRRITDKVFEPISDWHGKDEIGDLIDNYNYMTNEIKNLINECFESGKMLKNAEFKLLQAQINPHLLYNSLDNINILAIKNKVPEISSMAKALISFYKLGLNQGKDIVQLSYEIKHIQAYVTIQNLRFENGIILKIDLPQNILDCFLPKLALQPIIENSILHGIFEKEVKSGTIEITSKAYKNEFEIIIADDGIGMSEEKLEQLNTAMLESKNQGFGIKNVNERIKLMFGADYGLSFQSQFLKGTTVTIKLPFKEVQNSNF